MHDLTNDALVAVDLKSTGAGARLSIPALYERLMADDVLSLRELRPHQEHAAHAWLCQTAVIGLHKSGLDAPPDSEAVWHRILTAATHPHDTAWHMIVDDPTLPAFMQSPVPGWHERNLKLVPCPDDLDAHTETAKNHDYKQAVAWGASPSSWVWSLVALQTESGFSGRDNYGVARMNGSNGSRSAFAFLPVGIGIGARVRRDITAMLRHRQDLCDKHSFLSPQDGLGLLWLMPWSGGKGEAIKPARVRLDPYFVEICRLVRLRTTDDGQCVAESAGAQGPRIDAKALSGFVGDFWTPVDTKTGKALTMREGTLRYDRLARVLFDEGAWDLPCAMQPKDRKPCYQLHASGVAKGGAHGKSVGYKRRTDVLVPVGGVRNRDVYGDMSETLIGCVQKVADALSFGLSTYGSVCVVSNEFKTRDAAKAGTPRHRRAALYKDQYQAYVDGIYFEHLAVCANAGEDDRPVTQFSVLLIREAKRILDQAFVESPANVGLQTCAEVRALRDFHAVLTKWWPDWRDHLRGDGERTE